MSLTRYPEANTQILWGGPAGVTFTFYRKKPFNRFQVWMIGRCFGFEVRRL